MCFNICLLCPIKFWFGLYEEAKQWKFIIKIMAHIMFRSEPYKIHHVQIRHLLCSEQNRFGQVPIGTLHHCLSVSEQNLIHGLSGNYISVCYQLSHFYRFWTDRYYYNALYNSLIIWCKIMVLPQEVPIMYCSYIQNLKLKPW